MITYTFDVKFGVSSKKPLTPEKAEEFFRAALDNTFPRDWAFAWVDVLETQRDAVYEDEDEAEAADEER